VTNSTSDWLVDHYLTLLADAAQTLPADRRAELLAEIREHIAVSMSEETRADEAAVRTMLDRFGDPANRLVDQLADAAPALPADRRAELLAEIREHIAVLSGGTGADDAAVRTMPDRLGDPADIVAAAVEDDQPEHPAHPGPHEGQRPGIGLEVGAVVMLTVGSLIPVIGWTVGVILLWSSGIWRPSEKLLGTLVVPCGPGLALFGGAVIFALPPALAIPTGLFVLIAPIVVAIILLNRARARTALVRPKAID